MGRSAYLKVNKIIELVLRLVFLVMINWYLLSVSSINTSYELEVVTI